MEDNYNIPWQVKKYENMTGNNMSVYFDVEDFDEIIDYYIVKGLYKEAYDAGTYACHLHPSSIPLMLKKAQLLATFDQEADALELLARVESIDPENNDIFLTKGAIYSQLHDYNRAIEEYNKAVFGADDPDYVYCNIAFEYENLGNFDKTLEYLDKALKVNPDNDLAIYEAAYCFDLLSLTDEGISFFLRLIDRNPYSTEAWFNLGVSYINAGLYEKALEALEYSLAIDNDHEHSWFHKGYTLSLLERHTEAIGAFEQSMADNFGDPLKLYHIGECHEKLEDYPRAISFYLKSTKIDPQMADAWIGMGVCELEMGNTQDAVKYFQQALLIDHGNVSYLCLLANAYFLLDNKEKTKETYEQALESDPGDEETWLEYAEALANMNELDEAYNMLSKGVKSFNETKNIIYAMAAILFIMGKHDEGRFFLQDAYHENKEGLSNLTARFPVLKSIDAFLDAADSLSP